MINKNLNKLIVVLGPTASGKSGLALFLAKKFNGYIISADSRQIYKEMDIGTNKEKGEWKKGEFFVEKIKHFMIDIISPDENFSVGKYQKAVYKIIAKENPKSVPIIVGGTGLYISAVVDNLKFPSVKTNKKIRAKIEKEILEKGLDFVYDKLIKMDPLAEKFTDRKNPRRIIRALEVFLTTKKSLYEQQKKAKPKFEVLEIGIKTNREDLYKKIDQRVDLMITQGLISEVKNLNDKGYPWNLESMSGIGYKQIGMFLRGEISKEEAINLIKRDTRHYSKRQETWFKRDQRIKWIEKKSEAKKLVKNFLGK